MAIDDSKRDAWMSMQRDRVQGDGLNGKGGGGTSGPMADDQLAKRVDGLQTLVYGLLGLIAAAFLGLFGTIVSYSGATTARVDKAGETVSALNREVGTVGEKVDETNRRLEHIEQKLDRIGTKLGDD